MPDLAAELRALAADADWPPTPDVAAAVAPRLPAAPAPTSRRARRTPRRRRLVAALAAALLLIPATALALPGPRHAILDTLGLRHVTVQRRRTLPPAARDPRLGVRTTLPRAARTAGFTPRLPATLGPPGRVLIREGIVTLVYDRPRRLLLAEAPGRLPGDVLRKVVTVTTTARRVTVAPGAPGLYLADPHAYQWFDATGPLVRSGPALIWERDGLVLRLEGAGSLRAALRLARETR